MTNDLIYEDTRGHPERFVVYSRKLQERSFLLFEYYGADGDKTIAHLPFLQNISVSEKGKANLASYNLLGRAGQLFAYGGADSRKLDLEFHINLLHLLHLQETEGLTDRLFRTLKSTDKETDKKRFFDPGAGGPISPFGYGASLTTQFLNLFGENKTELVSRARSAEAHSGREIRVYGTSKSTQKAIDISMYWLNLVRSSILNNSKNTVYGPPIVRLNHGPMYMNSPCLVEDYKISVDKESNYDVETLFPYNIKVSMSLIESRTGDFGDYKYGKHILGDNLTGWESVLESNVLDSMNYNFEDYSEFKGIDRPLTLSDAQRRNGVN